jgi:hypothetical protein
MIRFTFRSEFKQLSTASQILSISESPPDASHHSSTRELELSLANNISIQSPTGPLPPQQYIWKGVGVVEI